MEKPKQQTDEEIVTESRPQTTGEILAANVVGENQADGTFDSQKSDDGKKPAEDPENEGDADDAEDDSDEEPEEEDDPDSDKDKA